MSPAALTSSLLLMAALSACGPLGSQVTQGPQGTEPAPNDTESPAMTPAATSPAPTQTASGEAQTDPLQTPTSQPPSPSVAADVTVVSATGSAGSYTFYVTLSSPDTGCEQYADWWEVLGEDGALLYRRVLGHSHVDEQPFTRSGGPVEITGSQVVIVRGHMNDAGYGGVALRGTVDGGFEVAGDIGSGFHPEVASESPLPSDCAF